MFHIGNNTSVKQNNIVKSFQRYQQSQLAPYWIWFYEYITNYTTTPYEDLKQTGLINVLQAFGVTTRVENGKIKTFISQTDRQMLLNTLEPLVKGVQEQGVEDAVEEEIVKQNMGRLEKVAQANDEEKKVLRQQNETLRQTIATLQKKLMASQNQLNDLVEQLNACRKKGDVVNVEDIDMPPSLLERDEGLEKDVMDVISDAPLPPPPPLTPFIAPAVDTTKENISSQTNKLQQGGVLDAIQKGTTLRKIEPTEKGAERAAEDTGLAGNLAAALAARRGGVAGKDKDEDGSEDDCDDWDDCIACGISVPLVRCKTCLQAMYCSTDCRKKDSVLHAYNECIEIY